MGREESTILHTADIWEKYGTRNDGAIIERQFSCENRANSGPHITSEKNPHILISLISIVPRTANWKQVVHLSHLESEQNKSYHTPLPLTPEQ